MIRWMNEWIDNQMDEQMIRWMKKWIDNQMNIYMDKQKIVKQMDNYRQISKRWIKDKQIYIYIWIKWFDINFLFPPQILGCHRKISFLLELTNY